MMKLPLSWLNDYTTIDVSPDEFCDAITLSGTKVETLEKLGEGLSNIVVGKILSIEKHPEGDNLRICQVDVGTEVLQIVTGASNVQENDIIPVAKVGAKLPGGTIKAGKLRGVDSLGMMCSTDELGISQERATGVLVLEDKYPLGMDIREALQLNESIIDFEITSNRPDCLGVIGIAREAAATLRKPFKIPEVKVDECGDDISNYISVRVEEPSLCPRYVARVVKNVKIGPSPQWLQQRLNYCGVRSINNVVDITNYVMLEYCQPMHAFDIRDIEGSQIHVRRAKEGERITTLDGVERDLTPEMLVIADQQKASAVAGVMGGENSEVKEDTTTIVFESANFKGSSVRKTAQKLGLRTESSARFEKGLDPQSTFDAVNRACQLICELGAGEVVSGIIDVDHSSKEPVEIELRPEKINRFLGTNIAQEEMIRILESLDFRVEGNTIFVPKFRIDVEGEADIAEEIARIDGYDKIAPTLLSGETTQGMKTTRQKLEDIVNATMVGCGFYEICTYTFTNPKSFDMLCLPENSEKRMAVPILNPLGEENSIMRTTSLNGMLEILSHNYNHRVEEARLFEIAKIYEPDQLPLKTLPVEKDIITLGLYGNCDFYDLKGTVEVLLEELGIKNLDIRPVADHPSYHPGKTAGIYIGKTQIAIIGEIHPLVLKNFAIGTSAFAAEIDFDLVEKFRSEKKRYKGLPKYPSVSRDLALLADKAIFVKQIEDIIKKCAGNLLDSISLFDVYEGEQVPDGKKSIAYAIRFRADDRTLKEEEITSVMDKILKMLQEKLGVVLR